MTPLSGKCRRYVRQLVVLCGLAALPACDSGPTAPESLEDFLHQQETEMLASAAGPWFALTDGGSLRLEFSLAQASDGRLLGSGMMKEARAAAPVPITVSGTYNRPNLSLSFAGIVYEGRDVVGSVAEQYTSLFGVRGTLRLTGDNYDRSLSLLLQEGVPPPASLGGRLTDAVTGAPVGGGTVSVQGRSETSSSTGHYAFSPNLLAGTFSVTVTHPLYVEIVRDIDIAPYRMVDFRLQPK